MEPKHPFGGNESFSTPPRRPATTDHVQGLASSPPSPSANDSVHLPSRPKNGAASAEATASDDKNIVDLDQQWKDIISGVSNSKPSFGIGYKVSFEPGREMYMYAKSMQLIKDIQSRGYTTVRMACSTLENIFSNIGELQKQNHFLKAKPNNSLRNRQSIVALRPTPPTVPAKTFTKFLKLPLEVRLMIWRFALHIPRTISTNIIIPRPILKPMYTQPLSNIRTVCRESRAQSLRIQVTLNRVSIGDKTIFINPSVDILWLSAWGISDDEWILVFKVLPTTLAHTRFLKIAVNHELWDRLMSGDKRSRFLDAFAAYGTEEIVIVMGNTAPFGSPDLVLREPRGNPREVLHTNFISRFRQLPPNVTWDNLNQTLLMEITKNKLLRLEARQRIRDAGGNPDHAFFGGRFKDIAHWNFKRVHFMEATTYAVMKRE
ncbi:hypothetical protein BKA64DRAFT_712216 [Cadophora sp. MPI-SDFR-AT-0126]|nr:hypothetical protein BKA64DRAFT_712216 [Leotiomycetes sp. MPI-SDFR-AT-0126]